MDELDRGRIAAMIADGMTVRDLAEEIGLSKSAVHRLKQQIEQDEAEAGARATVAGSPA